MTGKQISKIMAHEKIDLILKVAGAGFSGIGSLILAWRVKNIIKWVVYSLVAHEKSLNKILCKINGEPDPDSDPALKNVPIHLLRYLDKVGFCLLITGFVFLGVGMILNMIHFLL